MKKCNQCGQIVNDEIKFCPTCGGGNFTMAAQPQPAPAPNPSSTYQQNVYVQPAYQPGYQNQLNYDPNEPATFGDFMKFFLQMLIPFYNIYKFIVVAVGGYRYKRSLTNYVRAGLVYGLIIGAIMILFSILAGAVIATMIQGMLSGMGGYTTYY